MAPGSDGLGYRSTAARSSRYVPLDAPYRPDDLPATFLQRAGALLVDAVVAFAFVPLPVAVFFFVTGRDLDPCTVTGGVEVCTVDPADRTLSAVLHWTLAVLFLLAFSWAVSRTRTLGQRTTGVAVIDARTGARIGFGRAILRTLAMAVSALPLGLGFWWALWDPRQRTWHDIVARTRAISP